MNSKTIIKAVEVEIFNYQGFIRLKHPGCPVFVSINIDMDRNDRGFTVEFSDEQLIIHPAHINAFETTMNLAVNLVKQLLVIYDLNNETIPELEIDNRGVLVFD